MGFCLLQWIKRGLTSPGGRKGEDVGVMKDKELKDIEASHTLDGTREGGVQGRGKWRGFT